MERRPGNREIVSEYLHHKLAQRGYEWRADEWRSNEDAGDHGAPPELPDGAAAAATPTDGQDTLPGPLLREAPPDVHCALRWATEEFSRRYCRDYGHLSEQLLCPSPPGTARTRFSMVVEELFSNGINWGRIVAFFEFGGALCIESVHREMAPQLVDSIATWMAEYLDQHLQRWILDNGGWDAFVALYGNRGAPVFSFSWLSTKMFLGLAVLGVCLTLGAYLGHK